LKQLFFLFLLFLGLFVSCGGFGVGFCFFLLFFLFWFFLGLITFFCFLFWRCPSERTFFLDTLGCISDSYQPLCRRPVAEGSPLLFILLPFLWIEIPFFFLTTLKNT